MPRSKKRKKNFFPFLKAQGGKKRSRSGEPLLNSVIAVLSLVVLAFIISFATKYSRGGLEIDNASLDQAGTTLLATQYYDMNPVEDIEVEILNGCGETGLAAKITGFLRNQRIDVVRSENADHFNYVNTLIIQRNEKVDHLRQVAEALDYNVTDKTHVLVVPDPETDVDVTIIIGQDYNNIRPVADYLNARY